MEIRGRDFNFGRRAVGLGAGRPRAITGRAALAAALVALGGTAGGLLAASGGVAQATTGGAQYPEPKVLVSFNIGSPVFGRFYVKEVVRKSKVMSGELDIGSTDLANPPFMVGEILLNEYSAQGKRTTVVEDLYPFEFHGGKLSAAMVVPGTPTEADREGQRVGRLSLTIPKNAVGYGNKAKELKRVQGLLTVKGRGTYRIGFVRGDDGTAPPDPLPTAKQIKG